MKIRKIISALLTICLLSGCLCAAVSAEESTCPIIELDQTVTFDVTPDDHVRYYAYTAAQDGQVVLYGVGDSPEMDTLSVHSVSLDDEAFDAMKISSGYGRVEVDAVAGVTYWFRLDCWCPGTTPVTHSFRLSNPVEPEALELDYTPGDGFLGEEGTIGLRIYPMNAGGEIVWASSDPGVVSVTGDGAGAQYRLVGEGTAIVTVTASNGCSASVEISAVEKTVVSSGEDKEILIAGKEGNYHSVTKTLWFTPEISDFYSFSVVYNEEQHINHNLQMTVRTADGRIYDNKNLVFRAEAGVEYAITVDFWGNYDKDARYMFSLRQCVAGEHFRLEASPDSGFKGGFLQVFVQWDAVNSRPEELTWSSSDETVASIESADYDNAKINLLTPGTATITATNGSGLSASVDVVVLDNMELIVVRPGECAEFTLPAGSSVPISFTPEQTGYYDLQSLGNLTGWLENVPSVTQDGRVLYHLESGVTYSGYVENVAETMTEGSLQIILSELRTIATMEITHLPNNTTYLSSALEKLWTYQLLAGMQMQITWSDGTVQSWSFDREGPYVGEEDLLWELDQEQSLIILRCNQAETSFALTVQDAAVIGIRLKDDSPLMLAENSCGIRLEGGSWYYVPYQANLREVEILFSDGTSVTAHVSDRIFGDVVLMEEFQSDAPWVKGGEQYLRFSYLDFEALLPVEIIDSPVERIELNQLPVDTFLLGDDRFFSGTKGRYFFEPQDMKAMLKGLVFTVYYKDGSTAKVAEKDLQWVSLDGISWPFYDGCPLGLFSKVYADQYPISGPGDHEGLIEFMGAQAVYTIHFVNELPKPPVEPIPPTGDLDMTPMLILVSLLACAMVLTTKKKHQ